MIKILEMSSLLLNPWSSAEHIAYVPPLPPTLKQFSAASQSDAAATQLRTSVFAAAQFALHLASS